MGGYPCCCNPSGPWDVYGVTPYYPPFASGSSQFTFAPLTNLLSRGSARCKPSLKNSEAIGQFVYAGPDAGKDFGVVFTTLAYGAGNGDMVWYFRYGNRDNPYNVKATNYFPTAMSSWTYDPGWAHWDSVDSAVESLIDASTPPGGYHGLRAWATKSTTIPNGTYLEFRVTLKYRDLKYIQIDFTNFQSATGTLSAVATIVPGSEAIAPSAGSEEYLATSIFPQLDGYVTILIHFTASGTPTYLSTATVTMGFFDDYPVGIDEGTIVRSVQLREVNVGGSDIVIVDSRTPERLGRAYLSPYRYAFVPGNFPPLTADSRKQIPELIPDNVTTEIDVGKMLGLWGQERLHLAGASSYSRYSNLHGTISCNSEKVARYVANTPGVAGEQGSPTRGGQFAVFEYDTNGSVTVAKIGNASSSLTAPAIQVVPARDYPNVFGTISPGSIGTYGTYSLTYGEPVESSQSLGGSYWHQVITASPTVIYSDELYGMVVMDADAYGGQTIALLAVRTSTSTPATAVGPFVADEFRVVINGTLAFSRSADTSVYPRREPKMVKLFSTTDGIRYVVVEHYRPNALTTDVRVGVYDSSHTLIWEHSNAAATNAKYSEFLVGLRGSETHLYIAGSPSCDDRITTTKATAGTDTRDGISESAVCTWDGTRSWPCSRYGEYWNGATFVPDAEVEYSWWLGAWDYSFGTFVDGGNDLGHPMMDVVKNRIPYAPRADEYDNATCTP